jgi:MoxR-like ATPase
VILTTNEERALPDAFVRRCLVLTLALPDERSALEEYLVARGKAHFGKRCGAKVLAAAAVLIADDRGDAKAWRARGVAPPGLAEYIDLVRIVVERRTKDAERIALLDAVAKFTLRKHPDDPGT